MTTQHARVKHFKIQLKELIAKCVADTRLESIQHFHDTFSFYREKSRAKEVPSRTTVQQMAEVLGLNKIETNMLLNAAGYHGVDDYLTGDDLASALLAGQSLIKWLPFPAFIITRDDTIREWNTHATRLFQITDQELRQTPEDDRNILRYIFDITTPVYRMLTCQGTMFESWRYTARLNVLRFQRDNALSQDEEWYHRRRDRLKDLPEFASIWDNDLATATDILMRSAPSRTKFPEYVTNIFSPDRRAFAIRGLQIDYTGAEFPKIIAYVYEDDTARRIFAEFGLPTPDNHWGTS